MISGRYVDAWIARLRGSQARYVEGSQEDSRDVLKYINEDSRDSRDVLKYIN
jgi:hypothetical protein